MSKPRNMVEAIRPAPLRAKERSWHNGGDAELHLYARSLRRAAKAVIANLGLTSSPTAGWDASPVVLLYRNAMELYLKELVGEGCGLLPTPTDPLTLYKTHSLRWLAQIVCQIIKTARWESKFRCESVTDLAAFTALVGELEMTDPIVNAVTSINRSRDGSVPPFLMPHNVVRLSRRLDSLLDLLEATTDALAAALDDTDFRIN